MSTLRELMLSNIEDAKASVTKLEAELANLEATEGNFLSREVHEVQAWIQGLANHAFSRGQVPAPVPAPAPADVSTLTPVPQEAALAGASAAS